jgi:CheY-like chemotaxis protein
MVGQSCRSAGNGGAAPIDREQATPPGQPWQPPFAMTVLKDFPFASVLVIGRKCNPPNMSRVLVMDDEADTRMLIEKILESAGHEVVLAADGLEGMRQYHSTPVDLALVDLFMPNREGLETIKELKLQFPDFPIIAMSGDALALCLLPVAQRLGAVEVLQKPFLPEELLEAIKHVLRPKRRRTVKK